MIVARGTVVAVEEGCSVIRFAYPRCIGCTQQCSRKKNKEFRYREALVIGTEVHLHLPTYGLSTVLFLILGVPILVCALSFVCTGSVVWASLAGMMIVVTNPILFRRLSFGEYLLRPTISRLD